MTIILNFVPILLAIVAYIFAGVFKADESTHNGLLVIAGALAAWSIPRLSDILGKAKADAANGDACAVAGSGDIWKTPRAGSRGNPFNPHSEEIPEATYPLLPKDSGRIPLDFLALVVVLSAALAWIFATGCASLPCDPGNSRCIRGVDCRACPVDGGPTR
jgi:hypothetical protein